MPKQIPDIDKARIERMAKAGYTVSQISATTGLSKQQVYYREDKVGVRFGRQKLKAWTAEEDDSLRLWRKEGLSASIIAQRLGTGRSRDSIIGRAHRLGLSVPSDKGGSKKHKRLPTPATKATEQVRAAKKLAAIPMLTDDTLARMAAMPDTIGVASVLDLEDHHCRYPIGEPTAGFCGDRPMLGMAYCARHVARCYQPAKPITRAMAVRKLEVVG